MIKFLDLQKQYAEIKTEVDNAIAAVIADSAFIAGRYAAYFEEEFKNFIGVDYCVGVGNGTDALEIALEVLELEPGSEILVPANSFIASAEAITRAGHQVVFCDVNPFTMTIDVEDARRRITNKTRAIIAVHLYGHPADISALVELKAKYGLFIIEDCAQAHGARIDGLTLGSIGDLAAFSFYPGKNLGAFGDAGAITTNNKSYSIKARKIANHGRVDKYNHEFEGRNSRLDGLQAAILSVKLRHLNSWTEHRIKIASWYSKMLADVGDLKLPFVSAGSRHVFHLFVVRTAQRDALQNWLSQKGVETGIHYPTILPILQAYEGLSIDSAAEFPIAFDASQKLLSLPMGPHLTESDVEFITTSISEFYKKVCQL